MWFYRIKTRLYTPHSGCNIDTWPDVDKGAICGDCYALIEINKYRTCRTYCESVGLECLNAFEESGDSCTIKSNHNCDTTFCSRQQCDIDTSDALCKCSANRKRIVGGGGGSYESNEDRTIEANRRTSIVVPPQGIVIFSV